MQRDREGIRKMERLVLQKSYLFLTPLIVAIAPLFLPYILRYKTQGRSAQCILIPKLKHYFQSSPPVFPLGNIGGVSAGRGG